MENIDLFTSVAFGAYPKTCLQLALETVDNYFYLGGKRAYVIPEHSQEGKEGVVLIEDSAPFLMTALKVTSYVSILLPAILLIAKIVLRSVYTFYAINLQEKLEENIEISEETTQKINGFWSKIMSQQEDPEITFYPSQNKVFSLQSVPNVIFKKSLDINGRFENMMKAKAVCLAHNLDLLVIPHAKALYLERGITLIAEERLNVQQSQSIQERLYEQLPGLDETAKQLATFIAQTGFSDVEWRNMPILDDALDFEGPRRIALVDLEHMESAEMGIFGCNVFRRRGLIRCLSSEKQMDIALAEAYRYGITHGDAYQIKAKRIEELQNAKALNRFYTDQGILENPTKPIQIDDLNALGLDLKEQGSIRTGKRLVKGSNLSSWEWETTSVTMEQAIKDVIAALNQGITLQGQEKASLKEKRCIRLDHQSDREEDRLFKEYDTLGLPGFRLHYTEEELEQRWLKRIIDALKDKGYVFSLRIDPYGYFVQV